MVARYSHEAETIDYINNTGSLITAGAVIDLGNGLFGIPRNPIPDGALGHLAISGVFDIDKETTSQTGSYGQSVSIDAATSTVDLSVSGGHTLVESVAAGSLKAKVLINFVATQTEENATGAIYARPSNAVWFPADDTDAERGTILATALAAFVAGTDTKLELSPNHTYEVDAELSATFTRGVEIEGGTIKAASDSDLDWVLKVANNSTGVVQLRGIIVDHNNCVRTSGVGDTLFVTGTGQVDVVDCVVKNGPHDSNTNDATPSADGSLLRLEGSGIKRAISTRLIDAGYSTWRSHARVTEFSDVWSVCHTRKPGAYQRHGYCDSEAQNVNMLKISWIGGGIIDTAAHKVNCNLDPSSNGPEWLENLYMENLLWDISTSHTNPDDDYFFKVNYIRRVHLKNVVQRHSTLDTISGGAYVDQVNTTSLEGFLNIGLCEKVIVENCCFDGSIKGIGSGTIQCDVLTVRNTTVGENANIYEALINMSNFGQIIWQDNQIKNVVGRTAGSRCVFDATLCDINEVGGTGTRFSMIGNNYVHTNFPTAGGQTGALIRNAPLTVGQFAIDPIDQEYYPASMTWVQAFSEEQRLAVTAYSHDPLTLHLSRNVKRGGALRAIGDGSGVYTTTQQEPAVAADYFPDITGVPGARIWNDDISNGAAQEYIWDGTQWILGAY